MYLGIDGGGTKTAFALIDGSGRLLARHEAGGCYHLEIGLDGVAGVLRSGIAETLSRAGLDVGALRQAFIGLPAHGEDPSVAPQLDALPAPFLGRARYRCGNDVVASWAGACAARDGISVVAGTGSIAYGEFEGRSARAGGWGEVFGDEGSAHWIAREGLALFSRMSDGRSAAGPLHGIVRAHLQLADDLDLCAHVNGAAARSRVASFAPLVTEAAAAGDLQARRILDAAAHELAAHAIAVRQRLAPPAEAVLDVSYSGGVFAIGAALMAPFTAALERSHAGLRVRAPRLPPVLGAALLAARDAGAPLDDAAVARLAAAGG